jgi:hypothetical protein
VPNAPRIELPRPAIIALLGAMMLVVTFVVTKGSESGAPALPVPSVGSSAPSATTTTTSTAKTPVAKPAKPAKPKEPPVLPGPGLPAGLARALTRHEVVVLFFYEPGAADDQATRQAVRTMRSVVAGRKVAVFTDTVTHLANYRRIITGLGVSQTPAVVVVDKNRRAAVEEGFVDAGTLTQKVQDALHG